MKKRQIINIVNFIRGIEPRGPMDLITPVKEQIRLMQEHQLRGTFLIQYDALRMPAYQELLLALDPKQFEIGVWFETVQEQVEKAGLKWTGRFPWDWHPHCGFSVGYTPAEREKLIDVLYEEFRSVFGYYPRVFGSWLFDSHTIRYITEHYETDAVCNCKEQYGTDGYTLWGGYYGQAYYPGRQNVFMPAQSKEEQLPVPLFRMLGSDPVYQYDFGLSAETGAKKVQSVISLEPVYQTAGGGNPQWTDWFMKENFNGECLSFGYAQAGQENSFGWPAMGEGLRYQFALFEELQKAGKITVEPLGESGRWFSETYPLTPASAITAHTAYDDPKKTSVWYSSRFYRINLYSDGKSFRIRDLHLFSETFPDPYESAVCTGDNAVYESLPVIDGNRHSGNGIIAGGYFSYEDHILPECTGMHFSDLGKGQALIQYGKFAFLLSEKKIQISADKPFALEFRIGTEDDHMPRRKSFSGNCLTLEYQGQHYQAQTERGYFSDIRTLHAPEGTLDLSFSVSSR